MASRCRPPAFRSAPWLRRPHRRPGLAGPARPPRRRPSCRCCSRWRPSGCGGTQGENRGDGRRPVRRCASDRRAPRVARGRPGKLRVVGQELVQAGNHGHAAAQGFQHDLPPMGGNIPARRRDAQQQRVGRLGIASPATTGIEPPTPSSWPLVRPAPPRSSTATTSSVR